VSAGAVETRGVAEADSAWFGDPDVFRREIAERCRPVVLRGVFDNWPAVRAAVESPAALRDYLCRFSNGVQAQAFIGDPAINFERADMDVPTALEQVLANAATPGSPTLYMGSLRTETYLPGFASENGTGMLPPEISPRIWFGNQSYVSCHYDTYDNLAGVVAGRRRFTLYPPEAIAGLYVGPIDHTMAGQPVSLADGAERGDARYPAFEAIREQALEAELGPGDALYLPKLWWHRIEATDPVNVLVNYWWDGFASGPDAPYNAMLLSMIAIAERPAAEREAWKALFDHYVFRPGGHPLAHLPEAKHGILGPLASGNYGRIRAHIMRIMRGG